MRAAGSRKERESVQAARLEHIGARADREALTTEHLDLVKVVDWMIRCSFGRAAGGST